MPGAPLKPAETNRQPQPPSSLLLVQLTHPPDQSRLPKVAWLLSLRTALTLGLPIILPRNALATRWGDVQNARTDISIAMHHIQGRCLWAPNSRRLRRRWCLVGPDGQVWWPTMQCMACTTVMEVHTATAGPVANEPNQHDQASFVLLLHVLSGLSLHGTAVAMCSTLKLVKMSCQLLKHSRVTTMAKHVPPTAAFCAPLLSY